MTVCVADVLCSASLFHHGFSLRSTTDKVLLILLALAAVLVLAILPGALILELYDIYHTSSIS